MIQTSTTPTPNAKQGSTLNNESLNSSMSSPSRGRSTTSAYHQQQAESTKLTFHTITQPSSTSREERNNIPNKTNNNTRENNVSPEAKHRSMSPSARILRRISRSRSSSWGRSNASNSNNSSDKKKEAPEQLLVAVTSCKSDAYHYQKAPGATSRLPKKAPSALKNFHELAVGVKDAYIAVGALPTKPTQSREIMTEQWILFEFMGNLDFLLALVDEVAVDNVTRGALKDDTTFKGLRDVIKKSNKILESMLVRRERKYTLFFRLVQVGMTRELAAIQKWNGKMEKAIKTLSEANNKKRNLSQNPTQTLTQNSDTESDIESMSAMSHSTQTSGVSATSSNSKRSTGGSFSQRGRSMLLSAGRVRGRRATPTPKLRDLHIFGNVKQQPQRSNSSASTTSSTDGSSASLISGSNAAEDGFSIVTSTPASDLVSLNSSGSQTTAGSDTFVIQYNNLAESLNYTKPVQAKDELVDVIQNLRNEKSLLAKSAVIGRSSPSELKPNWCPKASIPKQVPKLPIEYVHRHRLMKHVVNSLLDSAGMGTREASKDCNQTFISSVTSRHVDKAGNGKTTLAVAAIQTVEVRERFSDGIAWIQLGRESLTEMDVRFLYEDIYLQLTQENSNENTNEADTKHFLPKSRRKFQGGELEGIKEDLATYMCTKKILLCIDDVWSADDLDWFLFQKQSPIAQDNSTFRIMITTRHPGLISGPSVHEVFVRIFSEHEAIKLLLASSGRHPYGSKSSKLFKDARVIVKGCGNSPMAIRVVGGMLRREQHSFTLNSTLWTTLVEKCRFSLEEATKLRSFSRAVVMMVDLTFITIHDLILRQTLRRCFVSLSKVFFCNDEWSKTRQGIPKSVILDFFGVILNCQNSNQILSPIAILKLLETMNLIERVGRVNNPHLTSARNSSSRENKKDYAGYLIHDSMKAIAGEMAARQTSSFGPLTGDSLNESNSINSWSSSLRNAAAKYLYSSSTSSDKPGNFNDTMENHHFQEIMVSALAGSWSNQEKDCNTQPKNITTLFSKRHGRVITCDAMEDFILTFLPTYLVRAKAFGSAGDLLVDKGFISKRVSKLGSVHATRRHVHDMIELRRELLKENGEKFQDDINPSSSAATPQTSDNPDNIANYQSSSTIREDNIVESNVSPAHTSSTRRKEVNINNVLRDGSRRIIDEVYRVDNTLDQKLSLQNAVSAPSPSSTLSLDMAICLSFIGEGLLRCRLTRDAMLRLEEAVGIYRGLLGPYHVDVARALFCAARAYVRIGENRVALLKFGEADQIFESCNFLKHCDALVNGQNMASLLFELGDNAKAESKYQDLITLRKLLPNGATYELARTLNDYAAVLAKDGKVEEALCRYEESRSVFQKVAISSLSPNEVLFIDSCYDIVMLDLNIASIKAKKGDIVGAIVAYENVVRVLRKTDPASDENVNSGNGVSPANRDASLFKHLLVAMGRIGSLKLKQGDNEGALQAYQEVLNELNDSSPTFVQIEVARSHIKCAMIYRQESHTRKAIEHLSAALKMYLTLYGSNHKDTQALQASLRKWQQEWQQRNN